MGADFMASWVTWPLNRTFEDWKKEAEKRINAINSIDDIDEPETLVMALLMEDVEELTKEMVEDSISIQTQLLEHLDAIDDECRSGGVGTVGNRYMLVTGGATWGDDPSDMFRSMNAVSAAIGVLFEDKEFSAKEQLIIHECAHQALRRPVVLKGIVDEMDDVEITEEVLEALRDKLKGED